MNLVGKYISSRYEIIEKVGNGGMATVYKAKCHVLNRYVAVKVLKEEFTTDEEFILFGKEIAKDKKYNVGVHRITIWKEDALEYEKMNLLT